MSATVKAEITRGPFDPGGQPDTRTENDLQVSFFAWNVQGGLSPNQAVLRDVARYRDFWHWKTAKPMLQEADRLGFDHQVQYGVWSGYGGPSQWNEASLDFASAATAASVVTDRMNHFSTVHIGYKYHPMHIAKIGGSIDDISGGRWGLNVVAGQNPKDFAKFGFTQPPSSAERYAVADEFTTLLKYLWTSEAPIDFEGEYFQAYGAQIGPRPIVGPGRPRPAIINAGQSEAGFDFACRQADWLFVAPPTSRIEDYAAIVEKARARAASYNREVKVAAMCYAVVEPTDAEARSTVDMLENEVDREAVASFMNSAKGTSNEMATDEEDPYIGLGREQFMKIGLGMGGFQIFGGHETVAETMRGLYEVGVENVVSCFWDPAYGVQQMGEHVFPILQRMGLRK